MTIWYQSYASGYEKICDWCDKINTYYAMLSVFVGIIKQQFFLISCKKKLSQIRW